MGECRRSEIGEAVFCSKDTCGSVGLLIDGDDNLYHPLHFILIHLQNSFSARHQSLKQKLEACPFTLYEDFKYLGFILPDCQCQTTTNKDEFEKGAGML